MLEIKPKIACDLCVKKDKLRKYCSDLKLDMPETHNGLILLCNLERKIGYRESEIVIIVQAKISGVVCCVGNLHDIVYKGTVSVRTWSFV